jgi:hypothetical protein
MLSLCNRYTLTVMDKVSGDTFKLTIPLLVDYSVSINFGYLHNVQRRIRNMPDLSANGARKIEKF